MTYDGLTSQYNPALRRWMTPDPLSEKYYGVSPYAFCNNNPVNFVDPDGRIIGTLTGTLLGGIFGGIHAYRDGENIKKGIVSGAVSGMITGAAIDLTVASEGTLGVIFGAAVVGESTTPLEAAEAWRGGMLSGAVSGVICVGSQVLSTAAKGTVNGLFSGVDDVKATLPNASDDVISEIIERTVHSEQQAIKNINKTQVIFELSAETTYFIQNETNKTFDSNCLPVVWSDRTRKRKSVRPRRYGRDL